MHGPFNPPNYFYSIQKETFNLENKHNTSRQGFIKSSKIPLGNVVKKLHGKFN